MNEMEFDEGYDDNEFNSDEEVPENSLKRSKNTSKTNNKRQKILEEETDNTKKSKNKLYKQPTTAELNELRETQNLFNSNLFRLQIDEILYEINIKEKHINKFNSWYKSIEEIIEKLPDFSSTMKPKHQKKKEKVFNYITENMENIQCLFEADSNLTIKLMKPSGIGLFSKYQNIANKNVNYNPHIYVTMPKSCFKKKDYLSHTYLHIKLNYLLYLKYFLEQAAIAKEIFIDYYLGNPLIPFLKIKLNSKSLEVNLFAIPENDTFKTPQFLPDKNNIKNSTIIGSDLNLKEFQSHGTFYYNSIVLFDLTLQANEEFIKQLDNMKNAQDAIKLLIVWLRQRFLNLNYRSFNNNLVIYLVVYLISNKKINKHMSSYQIVRIFWSFLSNMYNEELRTLNNSVTDEQMKSFKGFSNFVLLDVTASYNLAAFLDEDILAKVKSEAKMALISLDCNTFNIFSNLFTVTMPLELQFDALLRIDNVDTCKHLYESSTNEDKFRHICFNQAFIYNLLKKILKQGLTNRILEIIPFYHEHPNTFNITFGINLDPTNCSNLIEKGPMQYDVGAEEFKQFWGNKAELRRFKDTSIYEAVYFNHAKTTQAKRMLFRTIIEFIVEEKLNLNFELHAAEMESMIRLANAKYPFEYGTNEEVTLKVKNLHLELSKLLRDLQLPLPITSIQGVSDLYSYTDIFPPVPSTYIWERNKPVGDFLHILNNKKAPHLVQPIECVIELAMHSKWPNELNALRAMKLIYLNQIAKVLATKHKLLTKINDDYVDIYYGGVVFRIRLYHPKEIGLIKKGVNEEGLICYRDNEESMRLENSLHILPTMMGALNGLQQGAPSYGPSTCIIKRWLRSQMLDQDHISDIVINLLNAYLYVSHEPYRQATLPQLAFLRFLKFFMEFDFNFQPITVNFNDTMPTEQVNDLEAKFLQHREEYNQLHIITPFDEGKSVFTKHSPTPHVLKRIKCLATIAYDHLVACITSKTGLLFKPLFVPNLEGYNLLIELKILQNPAHYQHVFKNEELKIQYIEFDEDKCKVMPIVGLNPVEFYLKELRENYGHFALFFHDYYGGNVIGVLWKENVLESTEFKVATSSARILKSDELSLNIDALIEDFNILGNGLVKSIQVL